MGAASRSERVESLSDSQPNPVNNSNTIWLTISRTSCTSSSRKNSIAHSCGHKEQKTVGRDRAGVVPLRSAALHEPVEAARARTPADRDNRVTAGGEGEDRHRGVLDLLPNLTAVARLRRLPVARDHIGNRGDAGA